MNKVFYSIVLLAVAFVFGIPATGYGDTSYTETVSKVSLQVDSIKIGTATVVTTSKVTNYVWWYVIDAGSDQDEWTKVDEDEIGRNYPLLKMTGAKYSFVEDEGIIYVYWNNHFRPDDHEVVGNEIVLSLYNDNLAIQFRLDSDLRLSHDKEYPVMRYKYTGLAGQLKAKEWVETLCGMCDVVEKEASAYSENGHGGSSGSYILGTGQSNGWVEWHGQEDLIVYGSVFHK